MGEVVTPVPAATVVLAREGERDIEVLLLKRNAKLVFHGGHWVFPGGRIDADDFADAERLEYPAAVRAAVRETREEAGINIASDQLVHIAHWTTPPRLPRRFSTWFFLCPLYDAPEVSVDNDEILDYCWLSPEEALAEAEAEQMVLPGPTSTTLKDMLGFPSLDLLVNHVNQGNIRVFPEDSDYYRPEEMGYQAG